MPTSRVLDFDDRFVPVQSSTTRFVTVDREAVLLDGHGRVYRLNPTGAILWACFDGTGSLGEIAQDVSDELGVPYAGVLAEVVDLARRLGAAGLLDNLEPSTGASDDDRGGGVDPRPSASADTCPEEPAHALDTPGPDGRRFLLEPPNT